MARFSVVSCGRLRWLLLLFISCRLPCSRDLEGSFAATATTLPSYNSVERARPRNAADDRTETLSPTACAVSEFPHLPHTKWSSSLETRSSV